jgi:superoxide reductase
MTNYGDYYYCEICGQVVGVLCPGNPSLVCCGQKMDLLKANTVDASREKHVPVIVPEGDVTTIKVGSAPHHMTEEHHIAFIEIVRKNGQYDRIRLAVDGPPEATFPVKADDIAAVYAYCNLHSMWKA